MPRYNQPRKTWQYATDFKTKAVKLNFQDGIKDKQVAEGLDIHPFMLSRWRKKMPEWEAPRGWPKARWFDHYFPGVYFSGAMLVPCAAYGGHCAPKNILPMEQRTNEKKPFNNTCSPSVSHLCPQWRQWLGGFSGFPAMDKYLW